jgi:hypothetical protein
MSEAVSWVQQVAQMAKANDLNNSLNALGVGRYTDTGVRFTTSIKGQPASWFLWSAPRKLSSKSDRGPGVVFQWSADDPNPDPMKARTAEYRITDKHKPPAGASVEESKAKAEEWAKQFVLPTPEQQGANLAKLIEQMQQQGTPAPGYDPVNTVYTPTAKSKLPLIIGGIVLVAVGAALWWRFRK